MTSSSSLLQLFEGLSHLVPVWFWGWNHRDGAWGGGVSTTGLRGDCFSPLHTRYDGLSDREEEKSIVSNREGVDRRKGGRPWFFSTSRGPSHTAPHKIWWYKKRVKIMILQYIKGTTSHRFTQDMVGLMLGEEMGWHTHSVGVEGRKGLDSKRVGVGESGLGQ